MYRPSVSSAIRPAGRLPLRVGLASFTPNREVDELRWARPHEARRLLTYDHDLDLLDDFDRVLVFDDGRVVADDEPAAAVRYYRNLVS